MRKLIVNAHVSLDGVMQAPGGPEEDPSGGFRHGGWSAPYASKETGDAIIGMMAEPFDLLLGRRTYEIFAAYWPYHDDNPIGARFNAATKHVATRTLTQLEWENSVRLEGDVVAAIRQLKAGDGVDIHVWGSTVLLRTLLAAGLIDEYRLLIYPLVLDRGKRLFDENTPEHALTRTDSLTSSTGVTLNTYRPAGPIRPGSHVTDAPSEAELARRRKLGSETA